MLSDGRSSRLHKNWLEKTCISSTELYLQVNTLKIGKVCSFELSLVSLYVAILPLHAAGLNLLHFCGYKSGLRLIFVPSKVSSGVREVIFLQFCCSLKEDVNGCLQLEQFGPCPKLKLAVFLTNVLTGQLWLREIYVAHAFAPPEGLRFLRGEWEQLSCEIIPFEW